ncbi:MAG: sugar transferase [Pseudomonadota bacterium]
MRCRTPSKSQVVALFLLPFVLAVLGVLYVLSLVLQGRPFLYRSERMCGPGKVFYLYKIRTMTPAEGVRELALGGYQKSRITPLGQVLRRTRLDELPQIFNVLRGDVGFIGPRPPLRRHFEAFPDRYTAILQATRPGVTGLSTVMVHRREERILSRCRSAAETEAVYLTHCLPIKLRLDLLYTRKRGILLDAQILWWTFARLSPMPSGDSQDQASCNLTARAPVKAVQSQNDISLAA